MSEKIHYMPLQSGDRFRALRDGVIDLGSFNSSITFQRESESEVSFVHPMLFDGEVLMTPASNLLEPVEQAKVYPRAPDSSHAGIQPSKKT